MEHNSRLDKEILALRARVQMLDLERKAFLDLVSTHLLLLHLLACHGTNEPLRSQHSWAGSWRSVLLLNLPYLYSPSLVCSESCQSCGSDASWRMEY